MTLPFCIQIVYPGPGSPLILSWPIGYFEPWSQDTGGSRTAGNDVTESFVQRRSQLVDVPIRYFEGERQAVESFLAWASRNASTPFDFYFDQNIAATKYSMYLQSPVPGSGRSKPTRDPKYPKLYTETWTLRSAIGSPITLKWFADIDPAAALSFTLIGTGTVGGQFQITTPTVVDGTGTPITGRSFTFETSDATIATVDSDGTVRFVGPGTALITVRSGSVSASQLLTVTNPVQHTVQSIVVAPSSFTVPVGGSQQLVATAYDGAGGTGNIIPNVGFSWTSTDNTKATVDQTGLVQGIGTGGSSGSVSTAFVSDRSDVSPHYIDWNSKYTDFYHSWTTAERTWTAQHNDSQMSGDALAFLNLNPTGKHQLYTLLWTTINTGTGSNIQSSSFFGAMQAWYAGALNTLGGVYENGFLHLRTGDIQPNTTKNVTAIAATNPAQLTIPLHGYTSGQAVATTGIPTASGLPASAFYASGMIVIDANTISIPAAATTAQVATAGVTYGAVSNVVGDGTKTPSNRKVINIFGSTRWVMNFSDASLRAFTLYRTQQSIADPNNGVFFDEVDSSGINGGYLSVEYPTPNTAPNGGPYNNSRLQYHTDMQTVLNTARVAVSPKEIWINPAAFFTFTDDKNDVNAAGFGHLEQTMRMDGGNLPGVMTNYLSLYALSNAPGFEIVSPWTWTDNIGSYVTPGASGAYTTKTRREKGSEFTAALMAMPEPSTDPYYRRVYIGLNNFWSYAPSTAYLPMWERNHGRPIIPTYVAATNILAPPTSNTKYYTYSSTLVDALGVTCTIRARETDKALLLWNNSTSTSATANDSIVTVPLPASLTLSLLKEDGTLGPTITSIPLAHGEAVILMKTTGVVTSGNFTITATASGRSGSSAGTVGARTVATIALAPSTLQTIAPGATFTLAATPKDGANVTVAGAVVQFSSSNSAVATVDSASGLVTGIAAGNANIIASSQGISNSIPVTVAASSRIPTTIVSTPSSISNLTVGSTQTLVGTVSDQFSVVMAGQPVTFSTNNSSVATVGASSGVVTGIAPGSATITLTSGSATVQVGVSVAASGVITFNEPSAMTTLVTRDFNAKNELSYIDVGTLDLTKFIVPTDNTVDVNIGTPPTSGPNVLALMFPIGTSRGALGGQYNPGRQSKSVATGFHQLYVRLVVKVGWSATPGATGYFTNHSTRVNMLLDSFMGGGTIGRLGMIGADASGSANLFPSMRAFDTIGDPTYKGHYFAANVSLSTFITRAAYNVLEYRIVANTPGTKDGIFESWCNGVKVCSYTDVMWIAAAGSTNIGEQDIYPLWGTSNAAGDIDVSVPATALYWDQLYISAKAALTP